MFLRSLRAARAVHGGTVARKVPVHVKSFTSTTNPLSLETQKNTELQEKVVNQDKEIPTTPAQETNVAEKADADADAGEDLPWYLRGDNMSSAVSETFVSPLPDIPPNAPESMSTFLDLLSKEYGLLDIQIYETFDESLDVPTGHELPVPEYNIICTGKSDKHIYNAANELRIYIKKASGGEIIPKLEGFVSHSSRNAKYRRMLRRARKGPVATDNEYGTPANSWIMCETETDGIFIHILTDKRRQELQLEQLWGAAETEQPEVPHSTAPSMGLRKDDFFIGIKREYHTSAFGSQRRLFRNEIHKSTARAYSTATTATTSPIGVFYDELASLDVSETNRISELVEQVESQVFYSVEDFNWKFLFYKSVHLIDPQLVSYEQVVDTIWQKYLLALPEETLKAEREKDALKLLSFLLDVEHNIEYTTDVREQADIALDRYSTFLRQLYLFSLEKITAASIENHEQFLTMLWGLVVINKNNFIGPSTVDEVLAGGASPEPVHNEISVYRARGILDLIELNNINTSVEFDELVLYTLGNSHLTSMFWKYWEKMSLLYMNNLTPQQQLTQWVRMITYLSIRKNLKSQLELFNKHWDGESTIQGNFISVLKMNQGAFAREDEKNNFKVAIIKIIMNIRETTNDEAYESMVEFVKGL